MTGDRTAHSPVAALRELEGRRATGVLRVRDEGALHIVEGSVAYAECRSAPSLEHLLAAAPAPGALGEAGMEAVARLALHDAAYFLLGSEDGAEFTEGPPHRLAHLCRIAPDELVAERARRAARLDEALPSAARDHAPVVPVRRVGRQRVVLTAVEAEILLNADGRRAPADLARDLGRSAFDCLLAVRRLAAAGMLRPPQDAPVPDLPVRRRGETEAPEWEPVGHEVLLRLRSGLEGLA
ncbi:hypothetical protein [Actinomadura rugatobispora]|uniref:MarR family transcriptional regulator n=1 Tax=Actinomadura rugatobispora TaxID=1994 RepID=A0ABW0ZTP6_9ACTN|nr:hypothetical protein GCM10010200_049850 [Actinomadura rugatobispora]